MPFERDAARTGIVSAVFALASVALALFFGIDYAFIAPNHGGYFLVPVEDAVSAAIPTRPRHTVFVMIDGLRRDSAETMRSIERIAARGQCRVSDQGTYTISRPMYALLSTGVEVSRVGVRNNGTVDPVAAESVWHAARQSGLVVGASAHLSWFQELFPDGFDRYRTLEDLDRDVFDVPDLADLQLVAPDYVDEAQHHFGAHSPETRAAVERADRELGRLLDRLDLDKDVVVVTADHGHLEHGGHGGPQPDVRYVLMCVGGLHARVAEGRAPVDGRTTAPLLALLAGVRFPKDMTAVDDGLDALWEMTDFGPDGAAYVADRRAAVERFRVANRAAIARWLGAGTPVTPSWTTLAAREDTRRTIRIGALVLLVLAVVGIRLHVVRRHGIHRWPASAVWPLVAIGIAWLGHRVVLGELDFSALNGEARYLRLAALVTLATVFCSIVIHAFVVRRLPRFVFDVTTLLSIFLVFEAGHLLAYGWPLGFPLPSPEARYAPFFFAFVFLGFALAGLASSVWLFVRERRRLKRLPR